MRAGLKAAAIGGLFAFFYLDYPCGEGKVCSVALYDFVNFEIDLFANLYIQIVVVAVDKVSNQNAQRRIGIFKKAYNWVVIGVFVA